METKDILFFGAGVAAAMGYLYLVNHPKALNDVKNKATDLAQTAQDQISSQPIYTTPPASTVSNGSTVVNNPATSNNYSGNAFVPTATISQPSGTQMVIDKGVGVPTVPVAPVSQPSAGNAFNPVMSQSGGGDTGGSIPASPIDSLYNDGGFQNSNQGYASLAQDINLRASANNAPIEANVMIKRPVANTTVNSLYKQPSYMFEFSPLAN